LITNDAVIFGLLIVTLAVILRTSGMERFAKFYKFVPALLLCYFVPSLYTNFGLIDISDSKVYHVTSRYLLPASLILLTLSIDLRGVFGLGPRALVMFLTATLSIVLGGPFAMFVVGMVSPETVGGDGPEAVWRGMSTLAGSWIGGGANQVAMKEVFEVGDGIFSALIAVDVLVAKVSMAFHFYGAANYEAWDRWFRADNSAILALRDKIEAYRRSIAKIPSLADATVVAAAGLGVTGFCHLLADLIAPWILNNHPELTRYSLTSPFFWLTILATTSGLLLSMTPARKLEGVGASRMGSLFIYLLVVSIGMKMDISAVFRTPGVFVIGLVWNLFHVGIIVLVARLIRAPFFFTAVGSQANIGGAASAPVIAAAFHPALAPVGVMLAVFGYALGTYGAYACALMMKAVSGG